MFSFVDSRTVLLLVATQVVLLAVVKCQEEDRKWQFFFSLKNVFERKRVEFIEMQRLRTFIALLVGKVS